MKLDLKFVSNVFISVVSSLEDMDEKEQDDTCSIFPVRHLRAKPLLIFFFIYFYFKLIANTSEGVSVNTLIKPCCLYY